MNITLQPSEIGGKVDAICSKSVAHRMLICAALSEGITQLCNVGNPSEDILATISCLNALGANITKNQEGYSIVNIAKKSDVTINCKESGSTLRFLLPVISALGIETIVDGLEGLRNRPIKELKELLNSFGGNIEGDKLPLKIKGKIKSGKYRIDGNISSQYISGLLMALPLLSDDSEIIINGDRVSESYIDITVSVMQSFGINVKKTEKGFFVKGNQKYISPSLIDVEGDWSNAAFWLVNGAINRDTEVRGLDFNSKQGDKEIVDILEKMGAIIEKGKNCLTVKKSELVGTNCSIDNMPDIAPILSIAMAYAKGTSTLSGVLRLKIKESDRLAAIIEYLTDMGIDCRLEEDKLIIIGGTIKGCNIDCKNDHRVVMSGAIAGGIAKGKTTLLGAEAVNKSYPDFFKEYKRLGGIIND